MRSLLMVFARVFILCFIICCIGGTVSSTTISVYGPNWDKSYQAFQRGTGTYTAGWAASVTVDFGDHLDENDEFVSILTAPYNADMYFLGNLPLKYNFSSDNSRYSGKADTLYYCKATLWEMQMGPKVEKAHDISSFTMKKGSEKMP